MEHMVPDIDIEAESENIAFRKDGSPVYIGELNQVEPDEEVVDEVDEDGVSSPDVDEDLEEVEIVAKPVYNGRRRPAAISRTVNKVRPNVKDMSHEEANNFYEKVIMKSKDWS